MANDTQEALVEASMGLRRADPQGWAKLMAALALRVEEVTEGMVAAQSSDRLLQFQGRAQEIREVMTVLDAAPKLFADIQQRKQADAARRQSQTDRSVHHPAGSAPQR